LSHEGPQVRTCIDNSDVHARVELFGPAHRGFQRSLSLGSATLAWGELIA